MFNTIGLLPLSKVVEVDRSKMVGQYVGQTSPQTNKVIDEAMGGVLFIDEAYTLTQGNNDTYGQEAVDTLLKRMEDDRGKFVCIAAGYKKEMERFVKSNSGLESRFTKFINLADYTPDELLAIFIQIVKQNNFTLAEDAQNLLPEVINTIYTNRGETFANGRTIRNLFEETKRRQSGRIARLEKAERTPEVLNTIIAMDIPGALKKEMKEEKVS